MLVIKGLWSHYVFFDEVPNPLGIAIPLPLPRVVVLVILHRTELDEGARGCP